MRSLTGQIVFSGFGHAVYFQSDQAPSGWRGSLGYRVPGTVQSETERTAADVWSAGVMLLELFCPMPVDVEERRARETAVVGAVQERDFSTFMEYVLSLVLKDSLGGKFLSEIIKHSAGSASFLVEDPVGQIRRENVLNLLRLAFDCLHPDASERCTPQGALLSNFCSDYISESKQKEEELVKEGVVFRGGHTVSGKTQKDCVGFLVPVQGLLVVSLFDTAADTPAGKYAGVCEAIPGTNEPMSARRLRRHILPSNGEGLDGDPGGPDLTLDDLVDMSAPGSLFASCRKDPSQNEPASANVAIPGRVKGVVEMDDIRGKKVKAIDMFTCQYITWGTLYCWSYNWARVSGVDAYSSDEILRRQKAHKQGLPEYVKSIILRRREEALQRGGVDDQEP